MLYNAVLATISLYVSQYAGLHHEILLKSVQKAQETVAEHVKAAESQYQAAASEIKKLEVF